jgi:D-alanyl-D-alanine carboxypeptidase
VRGYANRVRALLLVLLLLVAGIARSGRQAYSGVLDPATTTQDYPAPPILARAAAMLDVDTGKWLYLANPDEQLPMASTTKLMTAYLALRYGHLQNLVTVSKAAATVGGSSMGLRPGERVSLLDLLYGLLLPSGNDAAVAIAQYVAGSLPAFVALMNQTAAALHLTHTHYLNPYGFFQTPDGDDPDHYSSARDLVLLAQIDMQNLLFRQIVATQHYVIPATATHHRYDLSTVNYVLSWYPGTDGVKPGWTGGAGICQVVDLRAHGRHLLLAILHTPNLYTDVRDLLDYGLDDFTWHQSPWTSVDRPDQYIVRATGAGSSWYFPYTGHAVSGPFLAYFKAHGGAAIVGYPQTEQVDVGGVTEQFFTNQILTQDPTTGAVTSLLLGTLSVPDAALLAPVLPVANTTWRTYFPQTGHTLTYRFRAFYLAHGGIATFGLPLTEKYAVNGTLVQYFQRAEFMWHALSASSGYVVLAPLGKARLQALGLVGPAADTRLSSAPSGSAGRSGDAPAPTPTPGG